MPPEPISMTELVETIDTGTTHKNIEKGIALSLSGGDYRVMLFHVGVLWRLSEFEYLPKLKCISSVSGESIISAVKGMN